MTGLFGIGRIMAAMVICVAVDQVSSFEDVVGDVDTDRPGYRHAIKIADRNKLCADNLAIVEVQRWQLVQPQGKEKHPIPPPVPDTVNFADRLQRRCDHKADLLSQFASSRCFRRLARPHAAAGEVPGGPIG